MSDENERSGEAEATPHRGRRRESPIIEGEAVEAREEAHAAAEQPRRSGLAPALPGLAALLLSGAALYLAWGAQTPQGPTPEAVAALGQRIDALEARLGALEAKPAPKAPELAPQLEPLTARIAALEGKPAPPPVDLGPLTARVDAVDKAAAEAKATAERAADQARKAADAPPPPKVDLSPLDQRLARLESEIGPLKEALAAPKTDVRATEAPNVEGVAPTDAAALAVVAESLRQQIDRGAPVARELGALEKLGVEPGKVAPLKPFAATGAPTAAQLSQDFAALAPAMLRAARPTPPENADLLDRLKRSAASLVRITPVGESAGEDASALVGRIEAALNRGDVAGALALYDRLPAESKAPARDWAARARQRLDAEAAARALVDEALDKLARK